METIFLMVIYLFFAAIFVGFIYVCMWAKKEKDKINKNKVKYSAIYNGTLKHTEGLPFASGVKVDVYYGRDNVVFKKDNQEVTLDCNKIIDIENVTGKDVKSQATGGALAGKVVGGGLGGAAVGALIATSIYFVITYKKDDETKYIILDTAKSGLVTSKIIKDFKANHHRETEKIEL